MSNQDYIPLPTTSYIPVYTTTSPTSSYYSQPGINQGTLPSYEEENILLESVLFDEDQKAKKQPPVKSVYDYLCESIPYLVMFGALIGTLVFIFL